MKQTQISLDGWTQEVAKGPVKVYMDWWNNQQWLAIASDWKTHDIILHKTIELPEMCDFAVFTANVSMISSNGKIATRAGIRAGSLDNPAAWGQWHEYRNHIEAQAVAETTFAPTNKITVFIRSSGEWDAKLHLSRWRNFQLDYRPTTQQPDPQPEPEPDPDGIAGQLAALVKEMRVLVEQGKVISQKADEILEGQAKAERWVATYNTNKGLEF